MDFKQLQIIDMLIQSPTMTTQDLLTKLKYSERQFEYTLRKVNSFFKEHALAPINADGIYIVVPPETYKYMLSLRSNKENKLPDNYILSNEERQLFLFYRVATTQEYLSLFHLIDFVQVSQSTISKDIKEINTRLKDNHLQIQYSRQNGYQVSGSEANIRYQLIQSVIKLLSTNGEKTLNTFIQKAGLVPFTQMFSVIQKQSSMYQINFVENRLREFCFCIILLLRRFTIKPNYLPRRAKDSVQKDSNEYKFAYNILHEFNISTTGDIIYLTTLVQSMSIGNYVNSIDNVRIQKILHDIIQDFSDLSGIEFSNQQQVNEQLFTHFRSMYYRLQYHFPILNPLTSKVIREYNEIFMLLSKVIDNYVDELGEVPNAEIAFLTIHLIGFIYSSSQKNAHIKTAAIVCPNGVGSSALAYLQLTSLFPQINFLPPFKYAKLADNLEKIDIIFSTFYQSDLFTLNRPCFVINPIMTTREKYELIQKVNAKITTNSFSGLTFNSIMKIITKHVSNQDSITAIEKELSNAWAAPHSQNSTNELHLLDVIDPDYIQLNLDASTPEQAISLCAQPLIDRKIITTNYLKAVLKNSETKELGNFVITPHIALPHASPKFGAKHIAISVGTLKHPIKFGSSINNPVKFIFFLSATNSTDHLQALQGLISLIGDSSFLTLLGSTTSKNEIYQYIANQQH
ncbi:BglG family transcription antiterminator [Lactiplantibacillus pentosus]|uniref:BglG family transcription antiterminator n=10 Tax=Bacillati TaxID=1783272 RepID=UPI001C1F20B0|nr:BglG family transcription antiterminator [Lactiplantibacillus pentosus]MBU7502236.1 BglG family transcription antiterminator [Lactiplantibacillus pentosus]MCT3305051.1 PRD domain-containing protein [Lactiplantibacillus pentosus]MDY1543773.1 BglG family transcription antiterminator [Lactiplantibacillus pentosus]